MPTQNKKCYPEIIIFSVIFLLLVSNMISAQNPHPPKLMVPVGHSGSIEFASFSSDGKRVLSADSDFNHDLPESTVLVWDLETGEIISILNTGQVQCHYDADCEGLAAAFFSPSGNNVITASYATGNIKFWDANTGVSQTEIYIDLFSTTPKNDKIVTANKEENNQILIRVWDTENQLLIAEKNVILASDEIRLTEISFTNDSQGILFSTSDSLFLWKYFENEINSKSISSGGSLWKIISDFSDERIITFSSNELSVWITPELKKIRVISDITIEEDAIIDEKSNKFLIKYYDNNKYENYFDVIDYETGNSIVIDEMEGYNLEYYVAKEVYGLESISLLESINSAVNHESIYFDRDNGRVIIPSTKGQVNVSAIQSGKLLYTIDANLNELESIEFSEDGNQFLTIHSQKLFYDPFDDNPIVNYENKIKIWDSSSGLLKKVLKEKVDKVSNAGFTNKGSLLYVVSNNKLKLWDWKHSNIIYSLFYSSKILSVSIPTNDRFLAVNTNECIEIRDLLSGKLLLEKDNTLGNRFSFCFSPQGNFFATFKGSTITIWNSNTGALVSETVVTGESIFRVIFSPDEKYLLADGSSPYVIDTKSGGIICKIEGSFGTFSNDNKWVLTKDAHIGNEGFDNIVLWDIGNCNYVDTIDFSNMESGNWEYARSYFISDKEFDYLEKFDKYKKRKGNIIGINRKEKLLVTSENNTFHFYNLDPDTLLYSLITANQSDYLVIHPDGYYDGTELARNILYFVCNGEVIDLVQMKDVLYVPGLVEKIINGQEINYDQLSSLDICDALPIVRKNGGQTYSYSISPRRLGLNCAEVYINNKLVYSVPKDSLIRNGTSFDLTLNESELGKHLLPDTANTIRVVGVVRTNKGRDLRSRGIVVPVQSLRRTDIMPPRLFAVMIGVNDYRDPSLKLNYPAKDAMELGKALETAAMKLLGKENVFMYSIYTGVKPGTGFTTPEKAGIKRALEDIGKKARPEDIVFMFFAGHGEMQGADGKLFTFLTADASKYNPIGISTKELQDWLSYEGPHKMLANKTILIFDACNSGQATQELLALARNDDDTRRIRQVEDLKDKSGMFILAGSAPNQSAYEMPSFQQGLLTYSLLSVLKSNPEVLDDGKYLNVQKWFLESERTLKKLIESQGLKQDAKPFGTANIRIGIVDEEVTGRISLAKEKPMIICDNVLNNESFSDELQLKKLINSELSVLSERGSENTLFFAKQDAPNANKINVSYEIQGDQVVCQIRLIKGIETRHSAMVSGPQSDLSRLVKKIIDEVLPYAR